MALVRSIKELFFSYFLFALSRAQCDSLVYWPVHLECVLESLELLFHVKLILACLSRLKFCLINLSVTFIAKEEKHPVEGTGFMALYRL